MTRLCFVVLVYFMGPHIAMADDIYTDNASRRALSQPMSVLTHSDDLDRFAEGRSLFNQMWVIAPSQSVDIDGLGPLYNALSCLQCHPGNGRGHAPNNANERMRSMLVRLSAPSENLFYASPHPIYGKQLQELAIPGVPVEGYAAIEYTEHDIVLADGVKVALRTPKLQLYSPGYGDWGDIQTSARVGPSLIGMGLIDAIDPQAILEREQAQENTGMAGRVNWVWDPVSKTQQIGRFGYKASFATLAEQIALAFHEDLGLTSELFPDENCSDVQLACQHAENGGEPELNQEQLDAVAFYLSFLAIPAPLDKTDEFVIAGQQLFHQIGCAHCHYPVLPTRTADANNIFSNRLVPAYSDFLLHDLGEGLADESPDNGARGSEWRTAPLWGLGRVKSVSENAGYLHDGRARTVLEAILWHSGTAQTSRDAVINLSTEQRTALLRFLNGL